MPTLVPVDHDPFADAGPEPSTALPAPGDPTSFTGQSPAGQTTPSRLSPDTMRAFAIDLMANGGKGAASILTQDPGTQYAKTYATTQAGNQANLQNTQRAILPLLDRIHDFADIGTKAGPDVLTKATGPNYGGGWIPLPDTSSQAYQSIRQGLQHLNPFSDQDSYVKATDANLEMHHLRDAIGAAVKAVPGGKNGTTDQDQQLVLDMVGKAMNAQDPETFYKILHDAENTLRGRGNLPALPARDSYLPESWTRGNAPAATASAQPSTGGFKYLGKVQ